MIRESFVKAIDSLEKLRDLSPAKINKLISLCKKVSLNHNQSHTKEVYELFIKTMSTIPDEKYNLHRNAAYDLANAFVELGKKHDKISRRFREMVVKEIDPFPKRLNLKKYVQFVDPHTYAMGIYLNLSARLEDLGLPAESYNALLKSIDPWVDLSKSSCSLDGIELENALMFNSIKKTFVEMFKHEGSRKNLVAQAALHFRLAKTLGTMDNDAFSTYKSHKQFTKMGKEATDQDILFYVNYLDFAYLKPDAIDLDEIKEILTKQYSIEKEKKDRDTSFFIACSLTRALNSLEWGEKALSCNPSPNFWPELISINVFVACLLDEFQWAFNRFMETFWLKAIKTYSDRMLLELCKQKHSDIINNMVNKCISHKEFKAAANLIYIWANLKPDADVIPSIRGKKLIIAIPNLYYSGGHFLVHDEKGVTFTGFLSTKKLSDVYLLKNKVESGWTALLHEKETLVPNLERRNFVELSQEYIDTLSEYIGVEHLKDLFLNYPDTSHFEYLELSWTNTPILPILTNSTNHTYSVSVDRKNSFIPRQIKKALIWADPDGSLPVATFEIDALIHLLSIDNIDYEFYSGSDCTKDLFLEKYSDSSFDLIWVISHGEFNSDNPPFSRLHISADEEVTAWELQHCIPSRENKRFLILNACQSGVAGVRFNSMGFLGIAPSITSVSQTVLGHLWYVDSLASATLGTLTLHFLLQKNTLPHALKRASEIMTCGNQAIKDALVEIEPNLEIIDRVRNTVTKDLSLPYYSMSALVFE
ncbi:CHAT domain-containing protein [Priestia megaterium]|uniref:CHAT domain-containing protein n=1 Tax=Priestia megaterium TaxID=1404 RepID=UPI001FB48183|nr:CHAT domain-containing protein [Priestia megaterium]